MDPGIHLADAARQRDGYPNPHPLSAMDPATHRGGQARRARWIRQPIAGTPHRRAKSAPAPWPGQARLQIGTAADCPVSNPRNDVTYDD